MKKFVVMITAIVSAVVLAMPVFATDQTISTEGAATVSINANVVSTFDVTCPTSVDITEREVKTFLLNASGLISPREYLSIDLPDTVTMSTAGKNPMDLVVTCDNEELSDTELAAVDGINIVCTIDATQITSGEWTGEIEVDIALKEIIP